MTKTELLADLMTKADYVGTEELVQNPVPGTTLLRYYRVMTHKADGDVLRDRNVGFFVYDEGGPAEAAYYGGSEPYPDQTAQFRDDLKAYLDTALAADQLLFYQILYVDEENEKADVRVIRDVSNQETEQFAFVYRQPDTSLTHVVYSKV